jgi:hypothetical protein
MELENKPNKTKGYRVGGLLFVGCMFIGMGIGKYLNELPTGLFIGMGIGFVAMAIATLTIKE